MTPKDKSKNTDNDTYKPGHENQNIRDFNPSQFAEEDEVVKNNETDKSKKTNKKDEKKKDE